MGKLFAGVARRAASGTPINLYYSVWETYNFKGFPLGWIPPMGWLGLEVYVVDSDKERCNKIGT